MNRSFPFHRTPYFFTARTSSQYITMSNAPRTIEDSKGHTRGVAVLNHPLNLYCLGRNLKSIENQKQRSEAAVEWKRRPPTLQHAAAAVYPPASKDE